jgi:hypothetical protein
MVISWIQVRLSEIGERLGLSVSGLVMGAYSFGGDRSLAPVCRLGIWRLVFLIYFAKNISQVVH